ncbi:MAG: ANTAR domain-containing protein [Streptosporangiaceae bacterium]
MVAEVDGTALQLSERLLAAHEQARLIMQQLDATRARLQTTRQLVREGRQQRAVLHDSAYARLTARLESMPLIEQAKGILAAQTGCHPDEAFNLLRTASQRSNVKVRDLAAEIVRNAADGRSSAGMRQRSN